MINDKKSELLLPVGNMNMCLAAIHNGADAIYVGMPQFNARGRSTDFSIEDLKEMIDLCHLYGVRVNLAFNIVIFENELNEALELIKQVLPLGPDALIIQDIGLCKMVREIAPNQIIHGSTQMTVTNFEAMSFLSDLSIKRFVLGRECSLSDIRAIKEKTDKELEVFVHGALCVAYSGQCFTSESIGGRSANRGQCAQSCRFEYEMIVDGKSHNLKDFKYLVSPKDLCGIAEIPELLSLGIDSFKVEGRLKTPEYVASAAKNYRRAIDFKLKERELRVDQINEAKHEMSMTYTRGFFSGWMHGVNHQDLVDGTYGAHRGAVIGKVLSVEKKSVIIESDYQKLKNGDGLLFAGFSQNKKQEIGGLLFAVKALGNKRFEVEFDKKMDLKTIQKDFNVYLNHDSVVTKKLTQSYQDKNLKKKIPLYIDVSGEEGSPLKIKVTDDLKGESFEFLSDVSLEKAKGSGLDKESLQDELGALGNTPFKLGSLRAHLEGDLFIHNKELKNLRRKMSDFLIAERVKSRGVEIVDAKLDSLLIQNDKKKSDGTINILLREINQIHDLISFSELNPKDVGVVYLDYEFGKGYSESVELLRKHGFRVGIATTRILKPNEYYNFKIIKRANPDVILCRNLGALYYFQSIDTDHSFELRGDFSLNVTNSLSARYLLSKNVASLCASYDLSSKQLFDFLEHVDGEKIEVNIHQYMPSFHMEHCVFAAFLSDGKSFRDCGKPCEEHKVELKDQFGNFHHIKADQECRNTMFNATAQSAARLIPELKERGVTLFRVEALYERGDELKSKILNYIKLIKNDDAHLVDELLKKIGVNEKYGLSEGAQREREHANRKK